MSGPVHGYGQANCVGQRGTEATEAWISHVCVSARSRKERKKWTKRLGGHACSDRALGRFRTGEEPRSIVQSRTIERGVLGTICGRRHGHRERPGGRIGRAVEEHARGVRTGAKACRPHAARFVSLPWDNARLPGGLPSRRRLQKAPPRSAHWGWSLMFCSARSRRSFPSGLSFSRMMTKSQGGRVGDANGSVASELTDA